MHTVHKTNDGAPATLDQNVARARRSGRVLKNRVAFYFHTDGSYSVEDDVDQFIADKTKQVKGAEVIIKFRDKLHRAYVITIGGSRDEVEDALDDFFESPPFVLKEPASDGDSSAGPSPINRRGRRKRLTPAEVTEHINEAMVYDEQDVDMVDDDDFPPSLDFHALEGHDDTATTSCAMTVKSTSTTRQTIVVDATSRPANTLASTSRQPNTVASTSRQPNTVASTSRQPNTVASTSRQPNTVASTSRQPNTVASTSRQPNTLASTSRQPNTVASTLLEANALASTSIDAPNSPMTVSVSPTPSDPKVDELGTEFVAKYTQATTRAEKTELLKNELMKNRRSNLSFMDKVELIAGSAVYASAVTITKMNFGDTYNTPRKCAFLLCGDVFNAEYMLTHSAAGQRGKLRVNEKVLNIILQYVNDKFPGKELASINDVYNLKANSRKRVHLYNTEGRYKYPKRQPGDPPKKRGRKTKAQLEAMRVAAIAPEDGTTIDLPAIVPPSGETLNEVPAESTHDGLPVAVDELPNNNALMHTGDVQNNMSQGNVIGHNSSNKGQSNALNENVGDKLSPVSLFTPSMVSAKPNTALTGGQVTSSQDNAAVTAVPSPIQTNTSIQNSMQHNSFDQTNNWSLPHPTHTSHSNVINYHSESEKHSQYYPNQPNAPDYSFYQSSSNNKSMPPAMFHSNPNHPEHPYNKHSDTNNYYPQGAWYPSKPQPSASNNSLHNVNNKSSNSNNFSYLHYNNATESVNHPLLPYNNNRSDLVSYPQYPDYNNTMNSVYHNHSSNLHSSKENNLSVTATIVASTMTESTTLLDVAKSPMYHDQVLVSSEHCKSLTNL